MPVLQLYFFYFGERRGQNQGLIKDADFDLHWTSFTQLYVSSIYNNFKQHEINLWVRKNKIDKEQKVSSMFFFA